VDAAPDHYRLEDIAQQHPIGASVFVPFAIVRLRGDTDATEAFDEPRASTGHQP
jgi:hypothetical protein